MGWLHVIRDGKGIELKTLNVDSLNFDMIDSIVKDSSILKDFLGKLFENYDRLTNKNKWILIGYCFGETWIRGLKGCEISNKDIEDCFDEYDINKCVILALAVVFSIRYGYPLDTFRSCNDYNGDSMIFCNVKYPPETYNNALANMTESTLLQQLRDFLYQLIGDEYYKNCSLILCEEYIKE